MKATIRLFFIVLAFLSVTIAPQARAVCQEGCLTNQNTALGDDALLHNTGFNNTAIGFDALMNNTTGNSNTAAGWEALVNNSTGGNNTALGYYSLLSNTTGEDNTALGAFTLIYSGEGDFNTAVGEGCMESNNGDDNTVIGSGALFFNGSGSSNTVAGRSAMTFNSSGNNNTAIGASALDNNTTGSNNIALGDSAGLNLTTGSNNIDIGNSGFAAESNTIRIGSRGTHIAAFIAGISGVPVTGSQVVIGSHGKLGVTASSERFKDSMKPMDKASEVIFALKPVTFRYKHELDPECIPQFGLIAEDVEKINPDLVARDEQGKPFTVRYEAVNAMLLNEFLKEHQTVQELKKQVAELTAGLQKVSAQLELNKPAPQTVLNNQ